MLLSDRDIKAEVEAGRFLLEPYDAALIQPSSVDVRLDRFFRVFANHRYTHIDPAQQQDDLTELIEPHGDEPFVLHPGEFVLGSTLEVVSLPDDLAARLEGKALAVTTPIPTPFGWRTMGDLAPGDLVFDEHGEPVRIVAATPWMQGRPCREVEFSDHTTVIADASHQWLTISKRERARGPLTEGVRTTDEVASTLMTGKEYTHHVPAVSGPVVYPTKNLTVDPYVLGIWLGDGTSSTADVTSADEQILGEIRAAGYGVEHRGDMRFRIGMASRVRDPRTGRHAASDSLHSELERLGLMGNKHVPTGYLQADPAQRLALLQGLMDSGGYCDEIGRCEFVSTREVLADAVLELAAGLGLRPVKRKKTAYLHGVDCGPAYQVTFTPHLPVFRLARKRARLKAGLDSPRRAIVAVRVLAESQPVRCIEVASPSGLFLATRSFIPTHNSSLGRLGLLTHSTAGFIDPGFSGHVTLELSNVANLPIVLWPGMKIGQICLFRLSSPAEHPYGSEVYGSRYQGQRGPTPSRAWRNFSRAATTPTANGT